MKARKALPFGVALVLGVALSAPAPAQSQPPSEVFPGIASAVVHHYDFEHPLAGDAKKEQDIGRSGFSTPLSLINGGAEMRVADGAYPASKTSMQLKQVSPTKKGNDDWKAGVWDPKNGSLKAFNKIRSLSVLTWIKITGEAPARNSNSSGTGDFYGAIGFAGILTGNSDGHAARVLLEVENIDGKMRLISLARRVDGSDKQFWASNADWKTLIPPNKWVFLAGTFDFDTGAIGLYLDGKPVDGYYAVKGDPWKIVGPPEPDYSSATNPRGIKIGGSHPANNKETNACNCRMDGLMFLDRALTAEEVRAQYDWVTKQR